MAQGLNIERKNGAARTALKARASDVMDDFVELRKDVNRLADAANKAARAEVKHAGKRISIATGGIRERASETVDAVRERAAETAEQAAERVRAHPAAAVGISLGVGVLLGALLTRR